MVLVLGYYGFGNLGDEAILAALGQELLELGVGAQEIVVPSGNPLLTQELHGVKALARYDFAGIWRVLGDCRCLIAGGGSLLQDVTSKRSIPYYLTVVELAFLRKVPVVMYGQGVGPVRSPLLRRWVRRAFTRSAVFSLRDQSSIQFLREFGVPVEEDSLGADPVFRTAWQEQTLSSSLPLVLINLRPYRLWQQQKKLWVNFLTDWQKRGYEVRFLPLGPGDRQLGLELKDKVSSLQVLDTVSLETQGQAFNDASVCISMRLHGVILAALHGVVPLGLNYDPKVEAICTQLAVPWLGLGELGNLTLLLERILDEKAQYQEAYRESLQMLREKTKVNRTVLAQVLGR